MAGEARPREREGCPPEGIAMAAGGKVGAAEIASNDGGGMMGHSRNHPQGSQRRQQDDSGHHPKDGQGTAENRDG